MELTKEVVVKLLYAWIEQEPGLDVHDYESRLSYRRASSTVAHQRLIALSELMHFVMLPFNGELVRESFARSSDGRLQITDSGDEWKMSYTASQYWPAEYRVAAYNMLRYYGKRIRRRH